MLPIQKRTGRCILKHPHPSHNSPESLILAEGYFIESMIHGVAPWLRRESDTVVVPIFRLNPNNTYSVSSLIDTLALAPVNLASLYRMYFKI